LRFEKSRLHKWKNAQNSGIFPFFASKVVYLHKKNRIFVRLNRIYRINQGKNNQ